MALKTIRDKLSYSTCDINETRQAVMTLALPVRKLVRKTLPYLQAKPCPTNCTKGDPARI